MNYFFKTAALLLGLTLSLNLFGQSVENKKINFGFGAGVSINNVFHHEENVKFKPKFSPILLTVNAQKPLTRHWSLFSELDYIHKGPYHFDINYLVLSVLPQYTICNKPNISFLAGPYVGYMFRYKTIGGIYHNDNLKKYDTGLDAAIMFSTKISKKFNLYISPRVEVGLIRFSFSNHISYQLVMGARFK